MAEYIEFEATKQAIDRIRSVYHMARDFNAVSVIDKIFGEIKEIPAADVAPVVHGRWVYHNFDTICSECRKSAIFDEWEQQAETEFCPHCGAKMDEEESDNV